MRKEKPNDGFSSKGSITVFLTLTLVLILSFFFSMLELARVRCLMRQTAMSTELCMQSMFGNYNAALWDHYGLLFLDGAWQRDDFSIRAWEERCMSTALANQEETRNLFAFSPRNIEVTEYELATDDGGRAFSRQVARRMQKEFPGTLLESLLGLSKDGEELEKEKAQTEGRWEAALDAVSQAEEQRQANPVPEPGGEELPDTAGQGAPFDNGGENPMDYVKGLKSSPILSIVLKDPSKLSTKAIPAGDGLTLRRRQLGNWPEPSRGTMREAGDRLWLHYYIDQYFSNAATESKKGPKSRALSYEMEYLIGGSNKDGENLERVVTELLFMREAANFLSIMQDAEKKSIALGIATATVGFTGMPPLIKAVQIGVLLAWAYVESIMDLRALLDGKKVPLVKSTADWSCDFKNARKSVESKSQAKEDQRGLDYNAYLQMLLFLRPEESLNYRCMDVIENNLRLTKGNERVRMDFMMQSVEADFQYEAKSLFWNLIFVGQKTWDGFSFHHQAGLSYCN